MTGGAVCLISVTAAFLIANAAKIVIRLVRRDNNNRNLIASGGMPSAHTASVAALAATTGCIEGLTSTIFALALVFLIVVAYDATHVRRAVGEQGKALVKILPKNAKTPYLSAGHSILEVFVGCALGVLVGVVVSLVLSAL